MAVPLLSMLLRGALPLTTSSKTLLPLPLGTLPVSALPHGVQLPSALQFGVRVVLYYGSLKNGLLSRDTDSTDFSVNVLPALPSKSFDPPRSLYENFSSRAARCSPACGDAKAAHLLRVTKNCSRAQAS